MDTAVNTNDSAFMTGLKTSLRLTRSLIEANKGSSLEQHYMDQEAAIVALIELQQEKDQFSIRASLCPVSFQKPELLGNDKSGFAIVAGTVTWVECANTAHEAITKYERLVKAYIEEKAA